MRFYLGTHKGGWLGRLDVPLCVSYRTLARRRRMPRARAPWLLDSGGYTELALYGEWRTPPEVYLARVQRFAAEIGQLAAATVQDWLCIPPLLAKTERTIEEHQRETVQSYYFLRRSDDEIPWLPVVQGYELPEYLRHVEMYRASGVDLATLPLVGVGSIAGRQSTPEAAGIVRALAELGLRLHGFGLRLHGFGVQPEGLRTLRPYLASADSMAWSARARRRPPLTGCRHASCSNCARYALQWRRRVDAAIAEYQPALF